MERKLSLKETEVKRLRSKDSYQHLCFILSEIQEQADHFIY